MMTKNKQLSAATRSSKRSTSVRAPRWVARMRTAARLVLAATEVHGKARHALCVEAAKIVVALREPRTHLLTYRRVEWLLEVAIGRLGGCVGCLAMGATTADKQLFARVKRAVNSADPIALLRAGAPDDEYDPEIDEITHRLSECTTRAQTQTTVHRVFVKWFGGPGIAGPRSAYRKLATALHALRPCRARTRAKTQVAPRDERLAAADIIAALVAAGCKKPRATEAVWGCTAAERTTIEGWIRAAFAEARR